MHLWHVARSRHVHELVKVSRDASEFVQKPTSIYGFVDKLACIPKGVEVLLSLLMVWRQMLYGLVFRLDYFGLVHSGLRFRMECFGLDSH